MTGGARAGDSNRLVALWGRFGRDLVTTIAVGLAAYSVIVTQSTVEKIKAEGVSRRDQTCIVFERMHQIDVRQLVMTYNYVTGLTADERQSSLNRAVVAGLPALEQRVKEGPPPPYCTKPGVGLDDRRLDKPPQRPPGLTP